MVFNDVVSYGLNSPYEDDVSCSQVDVDQRQKVTSCLQPNIIFITLLKNSLL
jgi:hypothetical protein